MLSDKPTPEDLPQSSEQPYAAVDRLVGPSAPVVAQSSTPSSPPSSSSASPPSPRVDAGPVTSPATEARIGPVVGEADGPVLNPAVGPVVGEAGAPVLNPAAGSARPAAGAGLTSRVLIASLVVVALVAAVAVLTWRRNADMGGVALPGRTTTAPAQPTPTATPTATPTPGRPTTSAPGTYPKALATYYTQSIDWSSCPGNAQQECTTIKVPVDYTKPGGETFTLALLKVPASDPSAKVGSLLLNPGGPGGSGIEYAQYADYLLSQSVLRHYDVIGFDPRGIGASDAVSCLTDRNMDQLFADDPTPDTPAERKQLLEDADAITTSCAAHGGQRALHMSSTEVARDMDIIRELVGDQRLNYLGVSYGTFLGALYADLFPVRVGRLVLDSAMSPNQTDEQEMAYDIQGFESSMNAFIDWCVARADCALGQDRAAAADKIVALLDRIDQRPLRTTTPGLETIGEGWVGFAIFMCLYSDSSWPTLNTGMAEALTRGTGNTLLGIATRVVERSSNGTYADTSYLQAMLPVRCADWARSPDTAALRAAEDKAKAKHPLWARMTGELYDSCAKWPTPGRVNKGTTLGVGAAPILVIGNLRDPATPIGGTQQLAKDLDSGVLVTSDHDGHGTYYAGNSCVDKIVDAYLVSGTAPAGDTAC